MASMTHSEKRLLVGLLILMILVDIWQTMQIHTLSMECIRIGPMP